MESIALPADYPDDQIDPSGLVSKYDGMPALKQAGFDVMCLANNHVLDGGQVGHDPHARPDRESWHRGGGRGPDAI